MQPVKCVNSVLSSDFTEWHHRLEYISLRNLSLIKPLVIDCKNMNNNHYCDIFPLVKQKRSSFPISKSVSACAFEHIHFDTWGPFSISLIDHKYFSF